jgi:hypothetical protein
MYLEAYEYVFRGNLDEGKDLPRQASEIKEKIDWMNCLSEQKGLQQRQSPHWLPRLTG